MNPAISLPEPGQLVDVRCRRYVVVDVTQDPLASIRDALKAGGWQPQHLVTLSSVEDDALGEDLQVIWEIEPGATAIHKTPLPEPVGFDAPQRLDTFLNAVRWGGASSADVRAIQAPFRSGVTLEDYQLDPVARAIQMPRVNLLIADDVGLGKTIEAGLVAQELIIRHRARRILIVCPAALQVQWRDQMRDKFGLEFRVIDSELMRTLRRERGLYVNPWTHFPRLITSIDFLKRERPLRLFREVLPASGESVYPRRFDLLIADAGVGRKRPPPSRQQSAAIDRLAASHAQARRALERRARHSLYRVPRHAELAVRAAGARRLRRKGTGWRETPAYPLWWHGHTRAHPRRPGQRRPGHRAAGRGGHAGTPPSAGYQPGRGQRALALANLPPLQPRILRDPLGKRPDIEVFDVPELGGSWAMCSSGLEHPHPHLKRPIVFNHDLAKERDDVVLAHLNSRLVAMSLRLLRAEIWASGDQRKLYRVTARIVPNDMLDTPAVLAHARLLILGGDNTRLHEELVVAGGYLREGRFARMNERQLREAQAAATRAPAPEAIQQRLKSQWETHRDAQALEARMRDRAASLQKTLAERAGQEQRDIRLVLSELQQSILQELRQPEGVTQLELAGFSTEERLQVERNLTALQARVQEIDAEIVEEVQRIARRFDDPQPRLFPVAVTYLVPEGLE